MRYTVVYDQTPHNYSAYVPDQPIVIVTGRTLAELEANARAAIAVHLRETPAASEPIEVELVHDCDYDGTVLTLNDEQRPAKPAPASTSA